MFMLIMGLFFWDGDNVELYTPLIPWFQPDEPSGITVMTHEKRHYSTKVTVNSNSGQVLLYTLIKFCTLKQLPPGGGGIRTFTPRS